jgi:hypothetical protein
VTEHDPATHWMANNAPIAVQKAMIETCHTMHIAVRWFETRSIAYTAADLLVFAEAVERRAKGRAVE